MLKVYDPRQTLPDCHDCGAHPGEYHRLRCTAERCPRCGGHLLICRWFGCEASGPREPWPPPLDDREVWTGEWPGTPECREFGWYVREEPGKDLVPCQPGAPGAQPDYRRLLREAEWNRLEKRYVRTTLTEAFAEMGRRRIVCSPGWDSSRQGAVGEMTERAVSSLDRGKPVLGYAYYTFRGKLKKVRGKDFALHFGRFEHPRLAPVGLPDARVGQLVTECLTSNGVKHIWDGDAARPIRVVTSSIVTKA